jgi:hypothetical protein
MEERPKKSIPEMQGRMFPKSGGCRGGSPANKNHRSPNSGRVQGRQPMPGRSGAEPLRTAIPRGRLRDRAGTRSHRAQRDTPTKSVSRPQAGQDRSHSAYEEPPQNIKHVLRYFRSIQPSKRVFILHQLRQLTIHGQIRAIIIRRTGEHKK